MEVFHFFVCFRLNTFTSKILVCSYLSGLRKGGLRIATLVILELCATIHPVCELRYVS